MSQSEIQTILLGLGTNLGDRINNLKEAINYLLAEKVIDLTSLKTSNIYETPALLLPNSPREWNIDFLNMAVIGSTSFAPEEVLTRLKKIEKIMGRDNSSRWSPRIIDIDILLYGEQTLTSDNLTIPHLLFTERDFALIPAKDIAPQILIPNLNLTVEAAAELITVNGVKFYAHTNGWDF